MNLNRLISEIRNVLTQFQGVDYACLFGSALKQLLPDSDIDILLGGDLDLDQKTRIAMKLSLRLKREVDLVLAKEAPHELISNALSRGRVILVHKRESLRQDYFKSYFLYDASTSLRKTRLERVKRIYAL